MELLLKKWMFSIPTGKSLIYGRNPNKIPQTIGCNHVIKKTSVFFGIFKMLFSIVKQKVSCQQTNGDRKMTFSFSKRPHKAYELGIVKGV